MYLLFTGVDSYRLLLLIWMLIWSSC